MSVTGRTNATLTNTAACGDHDTLETGVAVAVLSAASVSPPSMDEGDSGSSTLTFTVTLSAVNDRWVTMDGVCGYGDGHVGNELHGLPTGTLTFAAGDKSRPIAVSVTSDTTDEPNETVPVKLSSPTNAALGTATMHRRRRKVRGRLAGSGTDPEGGEGAMRNGRVGIQRRHCPRRVLCGRRSWPRTSRPTLR